MAILKNILYSANFRYLLLAIIVIVILFILKALFKKPSTRKQIGDKYEKKIGKFYSRKGYEIFYNGLVNGKDDLGVDIIAYKNISKTTVKIHLIQAKYYKFEGLSTDKVYALYGKLISYKDNETYRDIGQISKYIKNTKELDIQLVLAIPSFSSIKNARNNYALLHINKDKKRLMVKEI